MRKLLPFTVLVLTGFGAVGACDPKPGTRTVAPKELHAITRPVDGYFPLAGDATDLYWMDATGTLMTRPHRGGPGDARPLATIAFGSFQNLSLVREGAALWSEHGGEIAMGSKTRGARRVQLDHRPRGSVGTLHALRDGETVIWAEEEAGVALAFFAATLADSTLGDPAKAIAPREVGRIALAKGERKALLEPASQGDGFVVTLETPEFYRIVVVDGTKTPAAPREVHRVPRKIPNDDLEPTVELGTEHVYVTSPARDALDATPVTLLAIPRSGGAAKVIDPKACDPLVVLDDDPIYATTKKRCPDEFPIGQRIELRRVRSREGRSEVVYSVQAGSVGLTWLHGSTFLLDEQLPTPHPEGSAPTYDYRAALLTL